MKASNLERKLKDGTAAYEVDNYLQCIAKTCSYKINTSNVRTLDLILKHKYTQNKNTEPNKEDIIVSGPLQKTIGNNLNPAERQEYALKIASEVMKYNAEKIKEWVADNDIKSGFETSFYMPVIENGSIGEVGTAICQDAKTGHVKEVKADTVKLILRKNEHSQLGFDIRIVQPLALKPTRQYTNRDLRADIAKTFAYNNSKNYMEKAFYTSISNPDIKVNVSYFDNASVKNTPTLIMRAENNKKDLYELRIDENARVSIGQIKEGRIGPTFVPSEISKVVGPKKKVVYLNEEKVFDSFAKNAPWLHMEMTKVVEEIRTNAHREKEKEIVQEQNKKEIQEKKGIIKKAAITAHEEVQEEAKKAEIEKKSIKESEKERRYTRKFVGIFKDENQMNAIKDIIAKADKDER